MEDKSPCITCTIEKDPDNCIRKGCHQWKSWFMEKWEETTNRLKSLTERKVVK